MRLFYFILAGLSVCLLPSTSARAQTTLDPTFKPAAIYQTATTYTARQLKSGARLIAGNFRRADGVNAAKLVRYLPDGTLDAAFNSHVVNNIWDPRLVEELADGKLLVCNGGGGGGMTVSGQQCQDLVRLNADGTLDTSFATDIYTDSYINALLVQVDGKVVLGGRFTQISGQDAGHLARLNADGTLDEAFLKAGAGTNPNGAILTLAQQADGKLLVGGSFEKMHGVAQSGLVRLNSAGTLDASFDAQLSKYSITQTVVVLPNGKLLATISNYPGTNTYNQALVQLLPTGAADAGFARKQLLFDIYNTFNVSAIHVLADGKILFAGEYAGSSGTYRGTLKRLLPTGEPDPSFQGSAQVFTQAFSVLPTGQLLLAGPPATYASPTADPVAVGLFSASGSYDPSFAPLLETTGIVGGLAVQADGKIVIGGLFSSIGNVRMHNVARLNVDGTLDPTFQAATTGEYRRVAAVLVQPDGKILVAGEFTHVNGALRPHAARLLPTGALDEPFAAALPTGNELPWAYSMALQADGQVLLGGSGTYPYKSLVRITAAGRLDPLFSPNTGFVTKVVVQPDGRILLKDNVLHRLLSSGGDDYSFALQTQAGGAPPYVTGFALCPDGRILVGGSVDNYGAVPSVGIVRVLADGTPDKTFVSGLPARVSTANTTVLDMLIQPNGRILLGGSIPNGSGLTPSIARLLPTGVVDNSFDAYLSPAPFSLNRIVLQPDGALLVAGSFETIGGFPSQCIARLIDANVLHVKSLHADARMEAYPNPVHENLHLRFDAAVRPWAVALLDMTGKTRLAQPVSALELTLPMQQVSAGVYLLRVECADATITRRIVVQ